MGRAQPHRFNVDTIEVLVSFFCWEKRKGVAAFSEGSDSTDVQLCIEQGCPAQRYPPFQPSNRFHSFFPKVGVRKNIDQPLL